MGVGKRKKRKKKQREAGKKEIVEPLLVNLPLCSSIYSGETHSGAVTMGGDLYMWGSNDVGQLGLGERSTPKITPLFVRSLENYFCQNVSMGVHHTGVMFGRRDNELNTINLRDDLKEQGKELRKLYKENVDELYENLKRKEEERLEKKKEQNEREIKK